MPERFRYHSVTPCQPFGPVGSRMNTGPDGDVVRWSGIEQRLPGAIRSPMLYPTELQAHQGLTIHQWPRGLSRSSSVHVSQQSLGWKPREPGVSTATEYPLLADIRKRGNLNRPAERHGQADALEGRRVA